MTKWTKVDNHPSAPAGGYVTESARYVATRGTNGWTVTHISDKGDYLDSWVEPTLTDAKYTVDQIERDEVHHTDASLHTPGETSPIPAFGMLALPSGTQPTQFVQMGLFGHIAPIVLPSSGSPIAVDAASAICPDCGSEVVPAPLSDPTHGWNLYPCCHFECGCCFEVGSDICDHCEKIESECCDCVRCPHCAEVTDDDLCTMCDNCTDCCECSACDSCGTKDQYGDYVCGECGCGDSSLCGCCSCYEQTVADLNFVTNGWNAAIPSGDACERFREDFGQYVDPREAMSDFYLLDYIMAVLPKSTMGDRMHRVAYIDPDGAEYGERVRVVRKGDDVSGYDVNEPMAAIRANGRTHPLARDAATLQEHIVRICDDAFREYGFMAIGGEMRHEYGMRSVFPSHGRENTWGWVSAMGEKYGRVPMLEDFLRLCEMGGWDGGYGGKAWADCTKIVLMREKGDLDAKTFVDRCFALVHNSGCFIDKAAWGPSSYYPEKYHFVTIGNAHAAERTDFAVLVRNASDAAKDLLRALLDVDAANLPDGDAQRIAQALGMPVSGFDAIDTFEAMAADSTEYCPCGCGETVTPILTGSSKVPAPTGMPVVQPASGGSPLCLDESLSGGYVCTGPVGHAEAHMAYAGSMACNCTPWTTASKAADWGKKPAASGSSVIGGIEATLPVGAGKVNCGNMSPTGGYYCSGPVGHDFAHMAYIGHDVIHGACPIAPWPNETTPKSDIPAKITYNKAYGMICDEISKTAYSLATVGVDAIGTMALSLVQAVKDGASADLEALLLVEEQIAQIAKDAA